MTNLDPEIVAFAAFAANAAALYNTQHPEARMLGAQLLEHARLHRLANPSIDEALHPAMASLAQRTNEARDPKIWGPKKWDMLHRQARRFDAQRRLKATPQFQNAVEAWVDQFAKTIPCGDCKTHFAEVLAKKPVRADDVFAWSVEVHNEVNVAIGNPTMSLEAAAARWPA